MTKYIPKSVLVAEIEKRYEYWREKEFKSHNIESEIRMSECQHLMLLFNSIESKEVDLEKEAERFVQTKEFAECKGSPVMVLAKHFFELGMSVSNQLTWEDIKNLESLCIQKRVKDGLFDKEDYEEVLKRFKDYKERKENAKVNV